MPIANYTTDVSAETSATEIRGMLAKIGATVSIVYGPDERPTAMSFQLAVAGGDPMSFRLPARVDGVHKALERDWERGRLSAGQATRMHATDVAWRILRDWVRVQVAIIESSMVQPEEVFMPYALTDRGVTFFESFLESRKALPSGRPS